MPERIFLIECSAPHWLDVAAEVRKSGIIVSYWTGWHRMEADVKSRFRDVVFHDSFQAKIGNGPTGHPVPSGPFDEACQAVWEKEAQTVYDMMNRFDHSRDQTFVERSTLFYQHLTYWRNIIRWEDPSLVVFSTPPHVVYDYILLALCRELHIATLMFEEATIYPPYCLTMRDYRDGSVSLASAAKQKHVISPETREIVTKLRGDYLTAKPEREVIASKAMEDAIREGLEGLQQQAKEIKKVDRAHGGTYETNEKIVNVSSAYKERGKSLRESFQGPYANSRFMDQLIADRQLTDELRSFYHERTTPLEAIEQPYVYIPLAGQPERTSNPQAGTFANQVLMANLIASNLPVGWLLALKEHPNQFHPQFAVNMCRAIGYYQALLALGKDVRLVSTSSDPFRLVDGAKAIATTGGTTALEAVARGKPALLFGDAWYRDCPGVLRVRSHMEVKEALRNIASGEVSINQSEFENYVEAITKGCFRGLGDYPPPNYPMDPAENVRNLVELVTAATVRR